MPWPHGLLATFSLPMGRGPGGIQGWITKPRVAEAHLGLSGVERGQQSASLHCNQASVATVKSIWQCGANFPKPFPPNDLRKCQKIGFSSGARPPSAISLGGRRGGGRKKKRLTYVLFWPSAKCLPWRKGGRRVVERNLFRSDRR